MFISAATGWKIVIKTQIGRLKLPDNPKQFILEQLRVNAMISLPVEMRHALHIAKLPDYHRDLFDRMLVVQAQLEKLAILSSDQDIGKYDVTVMW